MLIVSHRQRDLEVFIGVEPAGIFEMAVSQGPGLAQKRHNFILSRYQVHVSVGLPQASNAAGLYQFTARARKPWCLVRFRGLLCSGQVPLVRASAVRIPSVVEFRRQVQV